MQGNMNAEVGSEVHSARLVYTVALLAYPNAELHSYILMIISLLQDAKNLMTHLCKYANLAPTINCMAPPITELLSLQSIGI